MIFVLLVLSIGVMNAAAAADFDDDDDEHVECQYLK